MLIAFTFVECNDRNIGMVFLPALPTTLLDLQLVIIIPNCSL